MSTAVLPTRPTPSPACNERTSAASAATIGAENDVRLDSGGAEPWAYGIVGLVRTVGDWWIVHSRPMSRAALTEYLTLLLWDGLSGIKAAADLPPTVPGR